LRLDQEAFGCLADWVGFDVVDALERSLGCNVLMENDGTAAAVTEMLLGLANE
jgi:predicted NBD/HSP70 family sugar kinase